ncbi:MAG: hypothetical protein IID15_05275 [Candidatus Marinimicrobia bacterium]|nr:hypothetical protein [Candidatus Neomarinimicrobiota bacterium]
MAGAAVFIYFAQLYGYVHFHHAHDSDGFTVSLSAHPLQIKHGDIHRTSDGDDDHEHQTAQHIEDVSWDYHRTLSSALPLPQIQAQYVGLNVPLIDSCPDSPGALQVEVDHPPRPWLVKQPSSLRAPPIPLA